MIYNLYDSDEKPLDKLIDGAGFCNIFRTIGIIGDSLSSGEMEYTNNEGVGGFLDMLDYSWGQIMARTIGCTVHNFSRGGMTAEEFCCSFAEKCNAFGSNAILCQSYIIALGVNDTNRSLADPTVPLEMGSVDDICLPSGYYNKKTIIGYYGRIIQKIKGIQPDAKIFLVTIPRGNDTDDINDTFTKEIYNIADMFNNTYVIDLRRYAPVYDDDFKSKFFLEGHMNAMGYSLTAKMMTSYIDYIIRHNIEDFKQVALIGTPYKSVK